MSHCLRGELEDLIYKAHSVIKDRSSRSKVDGRSRVALYNQAGQADSQLGGVDVQRLFYTRDWWAYFKGAYNQFENLNSYRDFLFRKVHQVHLQS